MSGGHRAETQGFYCKIDSDFIGVYPSDQGLKLFFNKQIYQLGESCWDVEIVVGKQYNLFIFYWKGEVKFSFRFAKHLDFFLWLHELTASRQTYGERRLSNPSPAV